MVVGIFELMTVVATQVPESPVIPSWVSLVNMGPYGVIIVLCMVVKHLYTAREKDREALIKLMETYAKEKQELNDKVADWAAKTTDIVVQNTEVQRQLLEAFEDK